MAKLTKAETRAQAKEKAMCEANDQALAMKEEALASKVVAR